MSSKAVTPPSTRGSSNPISYLTGPRASLRASDQILRLRRTGGDAIVTYKGPADRSRYKDREEIEFHVTPVAALELVLDRLGYQKSFRYEKYRTKFGAPGEPGEITLDETPIGIFFELEGPKDWIDGTAQRLGFAESDYLTNSYAALYQAHRKTNPAAPADMTFA